MEATPVATWTPCVTRKSPAGRDGQVNHVTGCCIECDTRPVRKQMENETPSAIPSIAATRSLWSGLAKAPSRTGPR